MNIKPTGEKVLLKVEKIYKKEGGKPVMDGEGNPLYDLNDFYVFASNSPEFKKGKKVFPIIRGGVPITELETKKHYFLVVDIQDIYAQEV